jgi:hypothetical protein
MGMGEAYTGLPPPEVFELFLNDLGTTPDEKLFLRQSLSSSLKSALDCAFEIVGLSQLAHHLVDHADLFVTFQLRARSTRSTRGSASFLARQHIRIVFL